ncbi:SMP-30/gluconolactonase/LRE family protein [Kitasatospora camelliae]|uniref:SMP-30/Gluconolactonase/LRE-like region domain-containing protein n=1 Tax=Kitasatospora camelliae TaxID=3156397 RepID=A0AAU8JXJ8_9ACTN
MPRFPRLAGALGAAAAALALLAASPATAVAPPLSDARILVHLDLAAGQMPENSAPEPDGSLDVTFLRAAQIARISPAGGVTVLADLPFEENPNTPLVGFAAATGLARAHDGTLYAAYATGTPLTGVYRLDCDGTLTRIAQLPPDGLPNGLALDEEAGVLYSADSAQGVVRRIPLDGGEPTVWASGTLLEPTAFIGANGIKVHHHAVWVSNTDRGLLLRIPVRHDGTAGPIGTAVEDLGGIDDFTFTGEHQDTVLAALNLSNQVAYVNVRDGSRTIVLTADDGLTSPTSVAVHRSTVFVTSAAFNPPPDPNVLTARLHR